MEMNTSIMIIWSLSVNEATTTHWEEIEPHHLLCAALKFAEVDPDALPKLTQSDSEAQRLMAAQERLITTLTQQWGIEIPKMSKTLRRQLRRAGSGNSPKEEKVIHRSDASRAVFKMADQQALSLDRDSSEPCDLVHAILTSPDEWIERIMKKIDLPREPLDGKLSGNLSAEWDGILHLLTERKCSDKDETQRIQTDPVVNVLCDWVSDSGLSSRPACLLVNNSSRQGEEFLHDVLILRKQQKLSDICIASVRSREFLEMVSQEESSVDASILQSLVEPAKRTSIYYFDSLHRYLSTAVAGDVFARNFRQWLKRTDGRFIFEIPKKKYHELIENRPEWGKGFHVIWANDSSGNNEFDL